ncbi:MAG: hypothetical protein Kow006_12360 [Gammaproteobacteria bacterium]
MSLDEKRPIIIKKVKKAGHGHHGGAWKIAYADFVTAMMAFFLLMWLLGSTTKAERQGIAEYFQNPLKVSLMGGSGSGDATSIIQGGGEDLSRSTGQVKRTKEGTREIVTRVAEKAEGRWDEFGRKLKAKIEQSQILSKFRNQLRIDITSEGLRIQIVDEENRPMFAAGSDRLEPYAREILQEITPLIAGLPNKVSITGHTDATPYGHNERGYTNWELSSDRANAARREMNRNGLPDTQVIRVAGLASSLPLDPKNPTSPSNRRIAIIVLNEEAQAELERQIQQNLEISESAVRESPTPPEASGEPSATDSETPAPNTEPTKPEPTESALHDKAAGERVPERQEPRQTKPVPRLPPRRSNELNPIRPPSLPAIPGVMRR